MGRFPALTENKDFKTAYYHGASAVTPLLVCYARKNRVGITRVGITVSKKIGHAVDRTRCRRIIRAAYAEIMPRVADGFDIVFVARGRTVEATSTGLVPMMEQALTALRVLSPDGQEERA